ncbi:MAG: class II aldolase/adducin family protein [Candidatus Heimdallarchaeota archaeon]|nr:class II aldolase/adducin family protein [Candidatus Heimdallarchaeota archaeon]
MTDQIRELKEQLCWASQEIYQRGLVNIGEGNISVRVKGKKEMIITPSRNDYRKPVIEDMVHLTLTGKIIEGNKKPSSESYLHRVFYNARPNVNCIIHTHSPYTSSLSIQHKGIPVIFEEMLIFLGGSVPCSKYALAGTAKLGKNAILAMGKQNAVILANHGSLVAGKTMDYCVNTAQLVEKMAKIYVLANFSSDIKKIPEEKQVDFRLQFVEEFSTV